MDDKVRALLIDMHRAVESIAAKSAAEINKPEDGLWYPPNGGLTAEESRALAMLQMSPALEGALRKVIANAAATPLFRLFACLDGVADPEGYSGDWNGLSIGEPLEDHPSEMLHDEFTESYWSWRALRRDPGWKLDLYEPQ